MANYAKLAETAKRLIEKNGRAVILRKRSEVPTDPDKPWRASEPGMSDSNIAQVECIAVFTNVEFEDEDETDERRDSQGALVAAKSADGVDLKAFDEVHDGTEVWEIDRVDLIYPGSTKLLWKMRLKR